MKKLLVFWSAVLIAACAAIVAIDRMKKHRDDRSTPAVIPHTAVQSSVERLIRDRSATITSIENEPSGAFRPVMIYAKRRDESTEYFVCAGTAHKDSPFGAIVITSEHMLLANKNRGCSYRIEVLRAEMSQSQIYLGKLLWKAENNLGTDKDVVVFSIVGQPVYHDLVSTVLWSEESKLSIGYPSRDGVEIKTMRSIVSGETFPVLGAAIVGKAVHPIIDCAAVPGESGTGFIDNNNHLWVLHADSGPYRAGSVQADLEKHLGKKLRGATSVAGPAPLFPRKK